MITLFGSCRQESLNNLSNNLNEIISYPHYTKEILEIIKFIKTNHISPNETLSVFRSPALNKTKLILNDEIINKFNNSELFFLEIASRKKYEWQGKYIHHIFYDDPRFNYNKNEIKVTLQTDDEIEKDILEIKKELNRPIIIISHICTYKTGERYKLAKLLEHICFKNNILFINPTYEFQKLNLDINNFVLPEKIIAHYTQEGHKVIKSIYEKYIYSILNVDSL
jgi:hypothetical protein